MTSFNRVKLQNPEVKDRSSFKWGSRKIATGLMATLIIVAMIAWFGFLGWGLLELLRIVAA